MSDRVPPPPHHTRHTPCMGKRRNASRAGSGLTMVEDECLVPGWCVVGVYDRGLPRHPRFPANTTVCRTVMMLMTKMLKMVVSPILHDTLDDIQILISLVPDFYTRILIRTRQIL